MEESEVYKQRRKLKCQIDLAKEIAQGVAEAGKNLIVPNHGSVHPTPQGFFVDMVIFIPREEVEGLERARTDQGSDGPASRQGGSGVVEAVSPVHEGSS